jgi:hypothetical protein
MPDLCGQDFIGLLVTVRSFKCVFHDVINTVLVRIQLALLPPLLQEVTCIDAYFFFFDLRGVRASLHAPRLIPRPTEHPANPMSI